VTFFWRGIWQIQAFPLQQSNQVSLDDALQMLTFYPSINLLEGLLWQISKGRTLDVC
jgi:hypothetical protein